MRLLGVFLVLGLGCASLVQAQGVPSADPDCSYDACALRIESTFFGGQQIVRGTEGEQVGRLGLWGSDLSEAVAGSEQAVDHALAYERGRTPAFLALLGGSLLYAVTVVSAGSPNGSEALEVGALAGGLGLSILGAHLSVRAYRESSRAVWWYNRDLAR